MLVLLLFLFKKTAIDDWLVIRFKCSRGADDAYLSNIIKIPSWHEEALFSRMLPSSTRLNRNESDAVVQVWPKTLWSILYIYISKNSARSVESLQKSYSASVHHCFTILAPVPLSIFRSNSKFDESSERSSFKYTQPITTIFCTRHDSDTVVTCAKYRCDRPCIFYTRVFWIFIEFRIRSKYA